MKEWIWAVLLAVVIIGLIVLVKNDATETATKEFEKEIVYGIASKSYQKVGKFVLMPMRDGTTMISFDPKPFTYAGAGANTKQGGKK
ncbi:MAG: hypothetical protein ABIF11_08765 [Nitrospirota bacterium]